MVISRYAADCDNPPTIVRSSLRTPIYGYHQPPQVSSQADELIADVPMVTDIKQIGLLFLVYEISKSED